MRTSLIHRLYATLGFMLAGGIPGIASILYDLGWMGQLGTTMSFLLFWYILIPGVLAGSSGFLFGGDILNPDKVSSAGQAALRGLRVSLVAWLAFVPILSSVTAQETNMSYLYKLFLILVFGSIIMGWLIASVGMATGWLLFRLRNS